MNYGMFCKKHNHQYEYFCPYCVLEFKQPIKHKEVSNMDFDLEAWWERSKKRNNAPSGPDIYTSEDEIYNLCEGLVGDVLNHCEREAKEKIEHYHKLFESENNIARELENTANMWRESYESLVEEAKQNRRDAHRFYEELQRIANPTIRDPAYTLAEVMEIARKALADRP